MERRKFNHLLALGFVGTAVSGCGGPLFQSKNKLNTKKYLGVSIEYFQAINASGRRLSGLLSINELVWSSIVGAGISASSTSGPSSSFSESEIFVKATDIYTGEKIEDRIRAPKVIIPDDAAVICYAGISPLMDGTSGFYSTTDSKDLTYFNQPLKMAMGHFDLIPMVAKVQSPKQQLGFMFRQVQKSFGGTIYGQTIGPYVHQSVMIHPRTSPLATGISYMPLERPGRHFRHKLDFREIGEIPDTPLLWIEQDAADTVRMGWANSLGLAIDAPFAIRDAIYAESIAPPKTWFSSKGVAHPHYVCPYPDVRISNSQDLRHDFEINE